MNIKELHDRLYDVLCTIDDICKQEGVRYFLDGGTAIGAVREKDFIPWDDDMDIEVLADDYPAFKAAMEKHLPPHMHLIEPDAFAPHFYDFTVRIYDDRFFVREPDAEDDFYGNLQNHVGTDVFIFYRAPAARWRQKLLVLQTKIFYGMGMAHRYTIKDEKYTMLQRMQAGTLRLLGRPLPVKRIWALFQKTMLHWQGKDATQLYTGNFPLPWLAFFPQEWYKTTSYGEIRGRAFPVAGNVDAELTALYGDYMHPPKDPDIFIHHLPAEDRVEPPKPGGTAKDA